MSKLVIGLGVAFTASLAMLYVGQSKLLYVPDYPIKLTKDNPFGYRSPLERQMKYQEVELKVSGPVPAVDEQRRQQPVTYVQG